MSKTTPNVQKLDVQPLDIRPTLSQRVNRFIIRTRSVKVDFWRAKFTAKESVTTLEQDNARN